MYTVYDTLQREERSGFLRTDRERLDLGSPTSTEQGEKRGRVEEGSKCTGNYHCLYKTIVLQSSLLQVEIDKLVNNTKTTKRCR